MKNTSNILCEEYKQYCSACFCSIVSFSFPRSHLNDNRWHTVGIRRPSAKQHTLMVDDEIVVAANRGQGNLELDGILYLGGVHKDLYSQLPQETVKAKHGFEGCIAGLDLNGESPNIVEDAVVHSSLVTAGCEGELFKPFRFTVYKTCMCQRRTK